MKPGGKARTVRPESAQAETAVADAARAGEFAPDPRLLAAMRRLELTARQVVAEAASGLHPGRRPGAAREFSQYRAYQAGDDPRRIDWKLLARSDRYYLREGELDTRVTMEVVLDATESMQHRGAGGAPSKFEVARSLAAAFGWLAEMQGDGLSLHVVARGAVESIATAGRRQPFRRLVHALSSAEPSGRWPADPRVLGRAVRRSERSAGSTATGTVAHVTIVLTDGHESDGEIRTALAPLRGPRHEVLFLCLVSPDERDFPYRGATRFTEWETGRTLDADAAAVRAAFLAAADKARAAWRRLWGGEHFGYLEVMTDQRLDRVVRAYLRRRAAR